MWTIFAVLLATVGLVATACAPDEQSEQDRDTGWTLEDAGPDSGPDGDGDVVPDEPTATTFKLVNTSDEPIQFMGRSNCQTSESEWVSIHDGDRRMTASSYCGKCSCSDVEDGRCAVCGAACAAPVAQTLQPGESRTWKWAGWEYRDDTVDGQQCTRQTLPTTKTYQAKFCWGSGEAEEPPRPGTGQLEDSTCETVDFAYGTDTTVTKEVEAPPTPNEPKPTTFRIRNESNSMITIQPPTSCGGQSDGWLQVRDDGGAIEMSTWCGVCQCSQISGDSTCAVCDAACVQPERRELAPGESAEIEWAGKAYRRGRKNGIACVRESIPEVGQTFDAGFCWTDASSDPDSKTSPRDCEHKEFTYGEDRTVTHTVEGDGSDGAAETTFRLVNDTAVPIRYQKSHGCTRPAWLDFLDDSVKQADGGCLCRCTEVEEHGSCPVCEAGGACQPPQIAQLDPGESVEWTWNGYAYKRDAVDEQTCHRRIVPSHGRDFGVEFCWQRGEGMTGGGELDNPYCVEQHFAYGDETELVYRAVDE